MTLEASVSENGSSPLQSRLGTNGGVGATYQIDFGTPLPEPSGFTLLAACVLVAAALRRP